MMHIAWCCLEEVPYCFSRSSVKFQGHTALKIVEFDLDWAFPDCNSSLNSPMAMKCCTKLETAKERCPIVFQGHPSNFKVTRYKTSPILTQIGRFRTIGRSQLSNPSDLPCFIAIRMVVSITLKLFCRIFFNWTHEFIKDSWYNDNKRCGYFTGYTVDNHQGMWLLIHVSKRGFKYKFGLVYLNMNYCPKQIMRTIPYWHNDIPTSMHLRIDGLVQDCSNSSALALAFLQSCTVPWTCNGLSICGFNQSHSI